MNFSNIGLPEGDFLIDDIALELPRILNEKVAQRIGYVAVLWSYIDHILLMLIKDTLSLNVQTLSVLVVEMSFLQKMSSISAAIHISRNAKLWEKWQEIASSLNNMRSERNDILHGLWNTKDGEAFFFRVKTRRRVQVNNSKHDPERLDKSIREMMISCVSLAQFGESIEKQNISSAIVNPSGPEINLTQSPKAHALDQARAHKRANRHPSHVEKPKEPKLSSAQKRALREAEKHDGGPENRYDPASET